MMRQEGDTGYRFKDILKCILMSEIERLYPALHEAPEEKFADVLNKRMHSRKIPTKLQMLRKNTGYSQRELSEKSGVNVRTLQQYEQRSKNINKAAADTLLVLSKTLGCRVEDLMEYE